MVEIKEKDIISKKKLNDTITLSNNAVIKVEKFDGISFKILVTGDINKIKMKSNFENLVLDFIKDQKEFNKEQKEFNKEQKEFNNKVITRLDKIETRLDKIEQLPTIKKELKSSSK